MLVYLTIIGVIILGHIAFYLDYKRSVKKGDSLVVSIFFSRSSLGSYLWKEIEKDMESFKVKVNRAIKIFSILLISNYILILVLFKLKILSVILSVSIPISSLILIFLFVFIILRFRLPYLYKHDTLKRRAETIKSIGGFPRLLFIYAVILIVIMSIFFVYAEYESKIYQFIF